ncbi:MAG TPA: DUF1360 domain-containing protein [Solirubrobacteraceae bacterium]|jgi:hypothetical protein
MSAYSPDEPKPLARYAALTAAFNGLVAGYAVVHRRSGRELPNNLPVGDFILMAAGTQKLSRVISKDRVTSFLRSPFTRYQGEAGPAEVSEEPRGTGLQLAIGELLVCPYCVGQWVAAAFVGSYIARPDATRMAATVFAVLGASDFLQQAWAAVDERA